MATKDRDAEDCDADFFIDITADVCPITFVKTKLLIERMESGQTAEIRLSGAEPLTNVPRAVALQGHLVVAVEPEVATSPQHPQSPPNPHGPHRLRLRKV